MSEIEQQLRTRGHASADLGELAELEMPVKEWRREARAAARRLGRPVETLVSGARVYASLRDWPSNDLERQVHAAALRHAARVVGRGLNLTLE